MKNFKFIIVLVALFAFVITVQSCKDKSTTTEAKTENSTKQSKEYTSAYICPMHCEGSGSEQPGNCPVCGMKYKKNEMQEMNHDGHDHDGHGHDGHNH